MAAALTATAYDEEARVVENAAESALEHHLGMTCDPVAGYVQVPCIELCAFGAVKAWTAYAIASNEIASRHRVDYDATVMELMRDVLHHVAEEETVLLPDAERSLGDQLEELGAAMTKRRLELVAPKTLAIAWNTARALPASNVLMGAGAIALVAMLLGGRHRRARLPLRRRLT